MRILFGANPLAGHLYPLLPLARAARDAGHHVVVASGPAVEGAVTQAGLEFRLVGPDFGDMVGEALTRYPDTPFATVEDQQRFGFGRLFSEVRVDMTAPDVAAAIADLDPDLIVHESADFVSPLVATIAGQPSVAVGIGLLVAEEWLALAASGVATAWETAGLARPPDAGLYRGPYLSQWPLALQPGRPAGVTDLRALRPVAFGAGVGLPPDLDHLGRERPLVYITFGTVFGNPDAISTILDGLAGVDVDVLVTTGPDTAPESVAHVHDHAHLRRFVPQGAVLDRCALVVTHGGAGSVLGAMASGVPLLVIPTGADQAENAVAVCETGVGHRLESSDLTAASARAAVVALLGDDGVRRAASAARREIDAMPSPAATVTELEAAAAAG